MSAKSTKKTQEETSKKESPKKNIVNEGDEVVSAVRSIPMEKRKEIAMQNIGNLCVAIGVLSKLVIIAVKHPEDLEDKKEMAVSTAEFCMGLEKSIRCGLEIDMEKAMEQFSHLYATVRAMSEIVNEVKKG